MKLKAALPKGDADGLSAVEPQAIKKQKPIVALVILEPAKIDEDLHTREKELIVSIRRIEALLAEDVEAATRLLQRAFESRTGEATLPLELENDVKDALKGVEVYVPSTETAEPAPVVPDGGYAKMTVPKLRELLKARGLDHSQGTKTELVGRLEGADADVSETPTNVTSLFNDGSAYVLTDVVDADEQAWDDAAPSDDDAPDEDVPEVETIAEEIGEPEPEDYTPDPDDVDDEGDV